jgi:hypothetical protein
MPPKEPLTKHEIELKRMMLSLALIRLGVYFGQPEFQWILF